MHGSPAREGPDRHSRKTAKREQPSLGGPEHAPIRERGANRGNDPDSGSHCLREIG